MKQLQTTCLALVIAAGAGALAGCARQDRSGEPPARQAGREAYKASREIKQEAKKAAQDIKNAGKEFRQGWNQARHDNPPRDNPPRDKQK